MTTTEPTIHASAVLVGARAALIRGPSGAGKSRLALDLIDAAAAGLLAFARLVADDRTHLEVSHGRLLARPAATLAGLVEVRGLGIRRVDFEPVAAIGLVVDLEAANAARLPVGSATEDLILGIKIPRLGVAPGQNALPLVLAWLRTTATPE